VASYSNYIRCKPVSDHSNTNNVVCKREGYFAKHICQPLVRSIPTNQFTGPVLGYTDTILCLQHKIHHTTPNLQKATPGNAQKLRSNTIRIVAVSS